jgi:hypothetical protein
VGAWACGSRAAALRCSAGEATTPVRLVAEWHQFTDSFGGAVCQEVAILFVGGRANGVQHGLGSSDPCFERVTYSMRI